MSSSSFHYLISHRRLLWRISASELRSRYAGSMLGIAWAFLAPWSILALYSCIYLLIFKVKVPGLEPLEYVLFVFSGLVPYFMVAESLSTSVGAVLADKGVMENTVFPIDLAAPKAVLKGQMAMVAGLPLIIVGGYFVGCLSWTALLLPIIWALQLLAVVGLAWIMSLLNVVFRDLQNLISVILMALLIASPFAYTQEMVPESLRFIVKLNPFSYYVIAYQDILVLGKIPELFDIVFLLVFSIGLFMLGGWFFARAKPVIVDYV